jgi:hypothetical protein
MNFLCTAQMMFEVAPIRILIALLDLSRVAAYALAATKQ